jgi:membrane dipeptidase
MKDPYMLVDAHQDIAWNMMIFGRDYTLNQAEIRRREQGSPVVQHNGDTLLGWDVYRQSSLAIVFATLFACPARWLEGDWETLSYRTTVQARKAYLSQIDLYRRLADASPENFRLLTDTGQVQAHLDQWRASPLETPVGMVLLMEGADGIGDYTELEQWWDLGLRIIGPAWAGTRFCGGTKEPGPLTRDGYQLLDAMAAIGFILDLSHMHESAALQALDYYPGRALATHANAACVLGRPDTNRHLSDEVIRALVESQGVIGLVPYNLFLSPAWQKGDPRLGIRLEHMLDHIDHVCSLAGNARHCGIGSDFDGGFGVQSVPEDVDSLADLQKLPEHLAGRGYSEEDIRLIMGANWVRFLEGALPE